VTKPLTAEERVVEALRAELRDVTAERDALRLEADGHRAARDARTGERDDMYIALRDVTAERDEARRMLVSQELRGVTLRSDGATLADLRAAVLEAIHHLENGAPNTQALAVLRKACGEKP